MVCPGYMLENFDDNSTQSFLNGDEFGNHSINETEPLYYSFDFASDSNQTEHVAPPEVSREVEALAKFLKQIVVPTICVFGIVGNVLTLVILTRKRLKSTCDGLERTVHLGLTALAVSDLLVCLTVLPYGLVSDSQFFYASVNFQLIYKTYINGLMNTFILTSTWLTVTMATSRYLAIVHPFSARHVIGMTGTKVSIFLVFFTCLLLNIPKLFETKIVSLPCGDGTFAYYNTDGELPSDTYAHRIYVWLYFTVGIFIPLATLAFCNICLVKTLYESSKLRKRYRVPAAHVDANYRITSILVTIVVLYIILVSPAEILLFLRERVIRISAGFMLAVEITNVFQTLNFSCNFVLYYILNVHFRQAIRDMVCFSCRQSKCCPPRQGKTKVIFNRQVSLRTSSTNV